jgi:hypothetical protein
MDRPGVRPIFSIIAAHLRASLGASLCCQDAQWVGLWRPWRPIHLESAHQVGAPQLYRVNVVARLTQNLKVVHPTPFLVNV